MHSDFVTPRRLPARRLTPHLHALLLTLMCLATLAGCGVPAEHPALQSVQWPPLIPAHRFAHRPGEQRGYQLSPDGRKLAWSGQHWLRSALFVRNNVSDEVRRYPPMTGRIQWTHDSRRLLATGTDTSGAENSHVYMLDTDVPDAGIVDLTPYPGVKATIHQLPPHEPTQILVYHNRRDPKLFDLYRIDLTTRKETLVANNPGYGVAPITTRAGGFVGWKKSREAARGPEERNTPRIARQPQLLKKPDETFTALASGADSATVWALSNRGRDRSALVLVHTRLNWEKVVFEDPHTDITRVVMSRVSRAPLIAHVNSGWPRAEILDDALRQDLAPLLAAQGDAPYTLDIASMDASEKRMVITIVNMAARRHYLLDRESRTHTLLAEDAATTPPAALATVQPVALQSRDGLTLHGYLTLPRGVPAKNLPMVLVVHGGPWLRTGIPYRSEDAEDAQFLANRGYAVLQVDFRGSTGYGKQHLTAAIGEFAGKMHEDLLDAVAWAVDKGIADPARVAIKGWSYGGYAAMVGLTLTPKTFACGISLGGPTDLASLIESFPPYWRTDLSMWHDYVGNPAIAQDRDDMTLRSPLTHAAKLERPLLIMHGAKDVRVRIDQAERMVAALRQAGKPVQYVPVADMGHGASWWVHRLAFLRHTENFLQRCLGGRASRIDYYEPLAWAWHRISRWRQRQPD